VVRTQIQLTEEQARKVRARARQRGQSMAETIRHFVERGLEQEQTGRAELYARAKRIVGRFPDADGAKDLAEDHDRYLDEAFE
jgi:L-serine deaminase